jgi:hypothetical protein
MDIQSARLAVWSLDDRSLTEDMLIEILVEFLGPNAFTNVRMNPKGFAIIRFTDPGTAERAIMRLNGLKVRVFVLQLYRHTYIHTRCIFFTYTHNNKYIHVYIQRSLS